MVAEQDAPQQAPIEPAAAAQAAAAGLPRRRAHHRAVNHNLVHEPFIQKHLSFWFSWISLSFCCSLGIFLCVYYNFVIFKYLKPRYEIIDRMEKQNTLDDHLGVIKDYTKYFLPQDLQA